MNLFPEHACSLSVEHNPHRASYISVKEWIEQQDPEGELYVFETLEARARSLEEELAL